MKIFALLLLIASLAWGGACAGANGYTFCQTLVLDHTKVPSNQSNYPAAICFGSQVGSNCLTNSKQLATAANGGFLEDNTNGFDFIITSDSGAMTPLNYEAVIHNLTTGATELWVLLPSISSTVDLTIYLFYGNASVTTDQSNPTAVWDTDYLAVHHFTQISGVYSDTDTVPDSTTANPFAVETNFPTFAKPTAVTAIVGGGANFDTLSCCGFINSGPFTNFPPNGSPAPFTLEGWFNTNRAAGDQQAYCIGANNASGDRWAIHWFGAAATPLWGIEGQNVGVTFPDGAGGGWHRIVTILPSGQTTFINAKAYVDGVAQTLTNLLGGTTTFAPQYTGFSYSAGILCQNNPTPFFQFGGIMDELRLSKIERSADWITTDYNNQSNVKAFWSESTTGTSNKGRTIIIN